MAARRGARSRLRIATFNVNGLTSRLNSVTAWLGVTQPDVVCLQELKTLHEKFPAITLAKAGYDAAWVGQKSWNGVAILSRIGAPVDRKSTRLNSSH